MKLKNDEQGYMVVKSLTLNNKKVDYEEVGTILEVTLQPSQWILPGQTIKLNMEFKGQVPLQIRRSGRNNAEGIEYSMAQWYPKMCNYDYQGWHAHPYVGREFYGIWGDFDVHISIDEAYVVGATGQLVSEQTIKNKKKWHFQALNVHDFVWAADPHYEVLTHTNHDGTVIKYYYQPGERTTDNWQRLPVIMDTCFAYINKHFGVYPYPVYSFIQGGDGGMEYPLATLITGERSIVSLVGVAVHELMHSWYQMMLGTNEALYPWMDEGFTSFASAEVMNMLRSKGLLPGESVVNPHLQAVKGYINFALSGNEEPLITHADHYTTNTAYGVGSYTKGEVFLEQLRYIVGEKNFRRAMLTYFDTWKFKHPNANDFIRVVEKVSDIELDWFREYFVNTIHTIDYSIEDMRGDELILRKVGVMPMPLDVEIEDQNGKKYFFHIPLQVMRGHKYKLDSGMDVKIGEAWPWTHPTYLLKTGVKLKNIKKVTLNPLGQLADVDASNDYYPRQIYVQQPIK